VSAASPRRAVSGSGRSDHFLFNLRNRVASLPDLSMEGELGFVQIEDSVLKVLQKAFKAEVAMAWW
jgi:hypothetical protein